jgi:hypothetical protein
MDNECVASKSVATRPERLLAENGLPNGINDEEGTAPRTRVTPLIHLLAENETVEETMSVAAGEKYTIRKGVIGVAGPNKVQNPPNKALSHARIFLAGK